MNIRLSSECDWILCQIDPILSCGLSGSNQRLTNDLWRRGGLMPSALVSGPSGPGSSPSQGHCVMFLCKDTWALTVPLSTKVYKWVSANDVTLGVTLRWTTIPSRGRKKLCYRNQGLQPTWWAIWLVRLKLSTFKRVIHDRLSLMNERRIDN